MITDISSMIASYYRSRITARQPRRAPLHIIHLI